MLQRAVLHFHLTLLIATVRGYCLVKMKESECGLISNGLNRMDAVLGRAAHTTACMCIHMYTITRTSTHSQAHTHTELCTHTDIDTHMCMHTYTHTCDGAQKCTLSHAQTATPRHTRTHTHTHARTHTQTHTHERTYTCTSVIPTAGYVSSLHG